MQLEIIMKPVNEIIPYWRNPRRNDKTVDELVKTIPVAGFNVPIVIDKNGVVVKGHARLKAAKRLGMTEVPCIVSDAPEDVIKADRIADNKIQELSAWDFGKLNLELETLKEKAQFKRLFYPEESPVGEATEMPSVEFKPVGLQFGEEDFGAWDGEATAGAASATAGDFGDGSIQTQAQPQAAPAQEKRVLRTLCPYCGKVVVLNV